jgi:enoyl-CoA hydratase/carnithine racemase
MCQIRLMRGEQVARLVFESPILSVRVLHDLAGTLDKGSAISEPQPLVISSRHPRIFLAGAHLQEIAALDARSSLAYANLGRQVLARLERYPAPVVAAVHGPCTGGGFDMAMCCDAIVAGPRASFSHPGVHRGLVTGWRGTVLLPHTVGTSHARRMVLEGSEASAAEMGELAGICSAEDLVAAAVTKARCLGSLHPARLKLWRILRESYRFVDRFRAVMVHQSW